MISFLVDVLIVGSLLGLFYFVYFSSMSRVDWLKAQFLYYFNRKRG
jgi:hypothetical protein